ncbi:MAG: hypothetical protein IT291_05565 [Deltaproteobacteria bacterium]|nr:hypothetical protein [Deltaproteobacteria bacterium]
MMRKDVISRVCHALVCLCLVALCSLLFLPSALAQDTAGWKNFFAVCWQDSPTVHIKYAKQMGYDYIGLNGAAIPSDLSWITARAGLKYYLVSPHNNKQNVFKGYKQVIYVDKTNYTQAEKDFYNSYLAWKSTDQFPNNLATGWFDSSTGFYGMWDFQQQRVIDHVVDNILITARSFENKSIGFTFGGVMFDVPRLWGDFHRITGGYTDLIQWTGKNSSLLHSGVSHQYATYPEGLVAFFKTLKTKMKQEFPNAKWIIEPAKLYNVDWPHADGWIEEVKLRADKNELTPDFLSQEHWGTQFVDDSNNFNSGMNIAKDMVGSTHPLDYNDSDSGNRTVAAKAAINGAWYNWFGRMGVLPVTKYADGDSIANVAPRLKLIRVLPNWDNLSNVPLLSRSWDGKIYKSTRSYADPNVIYSRHWKTGKLFAVFNTHSGVVKLNAGETIASIKRINEYFEEATDGSSDLAISGSEIRLKSTVNIPNYTRNGVASGVKGVGYIITLGGGDRTAPAAPTGLRVMQ